MKKIVLTLVAAILASSVTIAQNAKQYNLTKGMKFTVLSEINQVISQSVQGQNYEIKQVIVTSDDYEVIEVSKNGYQIKMTGDFKTMNQEAPTQSTELDSRVEGDNNLALKALTGKPFVFHMTKKGEILKIEGLDEYHDEISSALKGTALEAGMEEILSGVAEDMLISSLRGQFWIYPDAKEASWTRTLSSVVSGLPLTVTSEFSWDNASTILGAGEVLLEGSTTAQGMSMSTSMKGTQNTIYDLDSSTGLCTLVQTQQDMKGQVEMQGMSIPMETKTSTKVTFRW